MPRIQEYQQRMDVVSGPQESRWTFADTSQGEGIALLGQAVGQAADVIQRRAEQSELSELSVKMAETHSQFTNQMRDDLQKGYEGASDEQISGDPSERPMVKNFAKSYDDHVTKIGENVSTSAGQRYLQQTSAQMKSHFYESAVAGQAELAGQRAVQNYSKTVGALSSAVLSNPSSFEMSAKMHEDTIDNLVQTGGLPAAKAMQLKTQGRMELAQASIRGWIDISPDPNEIKNELKSGKWDSELTADLKRQLFGEADREVAGRRTEQELQRTMAERAKTESQHVTQSDFLDKVNKGQLSWKTIKASNLEAFGSGSKEQFRQMIEASVDKNRQPKTDWGTYRDTFARIHLPDGDPKKLLDENELNTLFISRKLGYEDMNRLRGEIQGKRTQAGGVESELKKQIMTFAESKLTKSNPMLGIKDPDGEEQMLRWNSFFYQEFESQRKQGKSATQLLSPDSPDYLGKHIGQYTKTPEQLIQGMARRARSKEDGLAVTPGGNVPQPGTTASAASNKPVRNPGESAADFLKRSGG